MLSPSSKYKKHFISAPAKQFHKERFLSTRWIIFSLMTVLFSTMAVKAEQEQQQPPVQLFIASHNCLACHNNLTDPSGMDISIGANWQSSMMANSSRDPYWQASVRRETLAHPAAAQSIQDECSACHMPMARYRAKVTGQKGEVFNNLPIVSTKDLNALRATRLAADGVSCSMCHQIQKDKLGTEASFTAGFVVDSETPVGQRHMFGPYDVQDGYSRIMESSVEWIPTEKTHVQDSALCGSCHTLYTHTRGPNGETIGQLPEQVPYLEWKHSDYYEVRSCQSCHMPEIEGKTHITSVLGENRENFSRHVFRGGNFFMPQIFKKYHKDLGLVALPEDLDQAVRETERNLQEGAAQVEIENARISENRLVADLVVTNLTGHKLPTAYPSRRAWIHVTVRDSADRIVFESGRVNPDGSIEGNINDVDKNRYEEHRTRIDAPDQVQIYEAIMANPQGEVTTGLIEAIRFIKDNRVLPKGFDKSTAPEDIAVQGRGAEDEDFTGATDEIEYLVPIHPDRGPFSIQAELIYQPIGFRWAQNLKEQQAKEIDRFVGYFNSMADRSWKVLAEDRKEVR